MVNWIILSLFNVIKYCRRIIYFVSAENSRRRGINAAPTFQDLVRNTLTYLKEIQFYHGIWQNVENKYYRANDLF